MTEQTQPDADDVFGAAVAFLLAGSRGDEAAGDALLASVDPYHLAGSLGGLCFRLGAAAYGSDAHFVAALSAWQPGGKL